MSLSGSDRRRLRALAHSLQPVVLIGQKGLTEQVVEAVDRALDCHELIKIRFVGPKAEKQALCAEIERRLSAHPVGIIGHNAILFRQNPDPAKRSIPFP